MGNFTNHARKATLPAVFSAALVLAAMIVSIASASIASAAAVKPKKGGYTGNVKTEDVVSSVRVISFTVRGKTILLTQEPVLRRGFCLSAPTFLLNEKSVSATINSKGKFSYARTVSGGVDEIRGAFVSPTRIEGTVTDNFAANGDLCSKGAKTVEFTAAPGTSSTS
jgi:hypothetical protein